MIFKIPPFAKRGITKLLILNALSKGPAHGYEIIKRIESMFFGLYSPSPGVIYPNLQLLEEEGYVDLLEEEGRKVYEITEKGREYLRTRKKALEAFFENKERLMPAEKAKLLKVGKEIVHDIAFSLHSLSKEQTEKIVDILYKARNEIKEVIERG